MTERLILQFLRLQNSLFYKFLAFRTPYFTVFASPERLILQISRLPNALFYSFCEFPDGLSAHYRAIWLSWGCGCWCVTIETWVRIKCHVTTYRKVRGLVSNGTSWLSCLRDEEHALYNCMNGYISFLGKTAHSPLGLLRSGGVILAHEKSRCPGWGHRDNIY